MDGCGEAGEAQGILQGSFDENFSATSWESCATSPRLRRKYGAPARGGLRCFFPGTNDDSWQTSVDVHGF